MSTSTPRLQLRVVSTGRERILDEAAELFLSNGYGDTSLRQIASAVGIQPASIYHYFSSKEALFTEILRIGIGYTTSAFDAVSSRLTNQPREGVSPQQALLAHIEAHLTALFEHGPYTAANIVVFPVAPPAVKAAIVPIRDKYEQRWDTLLQSLAASHLLDPNLDVRMARRILLGSINSTVEWFTPTTPTTPDLVSNPETTKKKDAQSVNDLAQVMTTLVWKGIGR